MFLLGGPNLHLNFPGRASALTLPIREIFSNKRKSGLALSSFKICIQLRERILGKEKNSGQINVFAWM